MENYSCGAYGAGAYQEGQCTTNTGTGVGAPDTGFFSQVTGGNPAMTGGFILAGAVAFAVVAYLVKRLIRKR